MRTRREEVVAEMENNGKEQEEKMTDEEQYKYL